MTILAIVLIVLAFLILVLAVPINADITVNVHGKTESKLRVFYFSPRLGWGFDNFHRRKKKRESGKSEGDGSGGSRVFEAIRVEGLWNRICTLIKSLAAQVRIRSLETDLNISLGDDYDTGMLAGLLLPITLLLNERFSFGLKVLPSFEEDLKFEGWLRALIEVRPISVLGAVAAFAFSRPALRAAWVLSRG